MHTTNYFNTLIETAPDYDDSVAKVPSEKNGKKTLACLQFEILSPKPYHFTSDEVLVKIFAQKNEILDLNEAKEIFFAKGQACFRASPLTKQYGWGVHFNAEGKMALIPCESDEYSVFQNDKSIQKYKAMRTKREK